MTDPLEFAAELAQDDQRKAGVVSVASLLVTFRKALIEGGFREDTAEAMSRDFFDSMIENVPIIEFDLSEDDE